MDLRDIYPGLNGEFSYIVVILYKVALAIMLWQISKTWDLKVHRTLKKVHRTLKNLLGKMNGKKTSLGVNIVVFRCISVCRLGI